MSRHKTVPVELDGRTVQVDQGLEGVVLLLNERGFPTNSSCVGERGYAWVLIQTFDEDAIGKLMRQFDLFNCGYIMKKDLYFNAEWDTVYVQYTLRTPRGLSHVEKLEMLGRWEEALRSYSSDSLEPPRFYATYEELLSRWLNEGEVLEIAHGKHLIEEDEPDG